MARVSAPARHCEGRNSKAANQGKQPACDQCRRFGTKCRPRAVNGRNNDVAKAGLLRPHNRRSARAERLAKGLQRGLLDAVDFEKVDDPSQLQQGLHPLMYVDQFHLAAHLPDDAVAAGQFAQAIAVHEVHPG